MENENLIKEYVKLIVEDDATLSAYSDLRSAGMGMMHGAHYMGNDVMYNIFIKPFADVIGVAAGKTKQASRRLYTLVSVIYKNILTSIIPVMRSNYREIFEKEHKALEEIKKDYHDVFEATWEAFRNDDLMIASFMFRPDLFLTSRFVTKTPKAAVRLLSVLSGGVLDGALETLLSKLRTKPGMSDFFSDRGVRMSGWGAKGAALMGNYFAGGSAEEGRSAGANESKLYEKNDKSAKKDFSDLVKFVSNEKVRKVLKNSPLVRQMSQKGNALLKDTLSNVLKHVQVVMAAKSIHDLEKVVGSLSKQTQELQKIPKDQRKVVEDKIVSSIKQGMKDYYAEQLSMQLKEAEKNGVPSEHPYVAAYNSLISKIKSMLWV